MTADPIEWPAASTIRLAPPQVEDRDADLELVDAVLAHRPATPARNRVGYFRETWVPIPGADQ